MQHWVFALSVAVLLQVQETVAFFRMPCRALVHERQDPLVTPGAVSPHVHGLFGGSNLGLANMTYETLRSSNCTSCMATADKSLYWTPDLFFHHQNDSFTRVHDNGLLAYYLQRGQDSGIQAFPQGFRMIAGDPMLRSYDEGIPSQQYKAVSFACLGSGHDETPDLPAYACPDGLRAQVFFPNCAKEGVLDSDDHSSHVAYSGADGNGDCPKSHPVRLVSLFLERLFDTAAFDVNDAMNPDQPFVFAYGDATGYGYHGDMINGWDINILQKAVDTCTADSGDIKDCDVLDLQELNTAPYTDSPVCQKTHSVDETVDGNIKSLPGNNPIQAGPDNATLYEDKDPPATFKHPRVYSGNVSPPGAQQPDNVPTVKMSANGYNYKGCYSDEQWARVLPNEIKVDGDMTVEKCLSAGSEAGYSICGLQYTSQCFCANELGSASEELHYSECNSLCAGDKSEYCGAGLKLTLYEKSSSASSRHKSRARRH